MTSYKLTRSKALGTLLTASFLLSACSSDKVVIVPVDVDGATVDDAEVLIEGTRVGLGPTEVPIERGRSKQILIKKFPEFFPEQFTLKEEQAEQRYYVMLSTDQAFLETLAPSEVTVQCNQYIQVSIPKHHQSNNDWWFRMMSLLNEAQYVLPKVNDRSGFFRTDWKERSYPLRGGKQLLVRRRFAGNVVSQDPLRYRLKYEIERKDPDASDFTSWDRVYPEDAEIVRQICQLSED